MCMLSACFPTLFETGCKYSEQILGTGSKKTAVAATPGKTKHFQTLIVSESLLLCDCPGLVLPRYAQSKAEMVAAGAPCLLLIIVGCCTPLRFAIPSGTNESASKKSR
jgi:hypothetical protein